MKKPLLAKCSIHAFQNRRSCPFSANRATQHKKPDNLQSVANHPVFSYAWQSPAMMDIAEKKLSANLNESWAVLI